jgi:ERCC4-type nuclease
MKITITIDYRENELIALCKNALTNEDSGSTPGSVCGCYKNLNIETDNLSIGDIVLSDDKKNTLLIIERKSLKDLAASIKDGRYEEQSYRLNECNIHNHNVIYLIEGDFNSYKRSFYNKSIPIKTLISSMISINYYKGFSLYRTNNILETSEFLIYLADKLQRENNKKIPFYSNAINQTNMNQDINQDINQKDKINNEDNLMIETNNANNTNQNLNANSNKNDNDNERDNNVEIIMDDSETNILYNESNNSYSYANVMKKTKKENITTDNIGEILLCQIPNVSNQSAVAIINKFKTIKNLIQCIENDKRCLDDILIGNNPNKLRKLNKSVKENIIKFLI